MDTFVIKRNGQREPVAFDKISERLRVLAAIEPKCSNVSYIEIAKQVIVQIVPDIHTADIDEHTAQIAAAMAVHHPDYERFAGRLLASNLQKSCGSASLLDVVNHIGQDKFNPAYVAFVKTYIDTINGMVVHLRDLQRVGFVGMQSLCRSHLLRDHNQAIRETPQLMYARVAVALCMPDIKAITETYSMLSLGFYTHATPVYFNAGLAIPQLASCFLLTIAEDSLDEICKVIHDCAKLSKHSGGIGLDITNVRAQGAPVKSNNGKAAGIVPMLRVFNALTRFVDQGSGKRRGAIAVYIEPWHADIFSFLDLPRNSGSEHLRARDLFYGLWIPDLFMKRVEAAGDWTLFCPSRVRSLHYLYGDAFDKEYLAAEATVGLGTRVVKAADLFAAIMATQFETGMPYMAFKDTCNRMSNQKHCGMINSLNLCTEIAQFTDADHIAVCNLASIALPRFIIPPSTTDHSIFDRFDWVRFRSVVRLMVRNVDRSISRTAYILPEATRSNDEQRPMGLGVVGLADLFMLLELSFDSDGARTLNHRIFEEMFYTAVDESCSLALSLGQYPKFQGSPISQGILHIDHFRHSYPLHCDWSALRTRITMYGVRNSLLIAPMPTQTTARILGYTDCIEPVMSGIHCVGNISGTAVVANRHLFRALETHGLCDRATIESIIRNNGSVAHITVLPEHTRAVFRTAWEIPQRVILQLAADRAPFIDQSASLNLFFANPTPEKLTAALFFGWRAGLKTGMFYLRQKNIAKPVQVTLAVANTTRTEPELCKSCVV